MPITEFQKNILKILSKNRNPDSYIAGGVAINKDESSSRYSKDIDIFHDKVESVTTTSLADLEVLKEYKPEVVLNQPGFVRAIIKGQNESLVLEWVQDTAFRFFPVIADTDFGYVLSDADLAINKVLALANRNEVRDIIDLIYINENIISLSAMCWAACGKDPGFTPDLLIDCIKRHSIIRSEQLSSENLVNVISPVELKIKWLNLLEKAEQELKNFPSKDFGCIYVDKKGFVVKNPSGNFDTFEAHYGKIGGCWPMFKQDVDK